jgi:hypothetical protein
METLESLLPSAAFEKNAKNSLGTDFQARLERLTTVFEELPFTRRSIPGLLRHTLPDELEVSSTGQARYTVTVFKNLRPAETIPPRLEHSNIQLPGDRPPQMSRRRYWEASKAALKNKGVKWGYVGSTGGIVLSGLVCTLLGAPISGEMLAAGPLLLLVGTVRNHYRVARRLLSER